MAEAMSIVSTKEGSYATYFTGNLRFDHVSGGLLFRLPNTSLDALTYFGL